MKRFFKRLMPNHEQIQRHRWLRWLGPGLLDPRLWHFHRRSVAAGVALGVFFGLLIPVAQIPVSAGAALLLRVNLPAAVGSTLVTNPVTVAPIYVLAHRLGNSILREENGGEAQALAVANEELGGADASWWARSKARLAAVGRPLMLGLGIIACVAGLLVYGGILLLWRLSVVRAWQNRRAHRQRRGD